MDKFLADSSGCYHISARTTTFQFDLFLSTFKAHHAEVLFYMASQEKGSIEKNIHYHYHFTIKSSLKLESIMNYLRKDLFKHYEHNNYYVSKVKKDFAHLVYITKECYTVANSKCGVKCNLPNELLEELLEENNKINHDKKLPMFRKLFLRYDDAYGDKPTDHTDFSIRKFILQCYKDWNILFPNRSQMLQYTAYIRSQYTSVEHILNEYYT